MADLSRTLVATGNDGRDNKYQYNGIEHIDEYGLHTAHARYRSLDLQLGTWEQIDPLAETPGLNQYGGYTHVYDNPISYADPLGLCPNCPENANKGDAHTWAGQEFIYDGERWSAMLPETEVNAAPKSTDSEMWASYGKAMGEFGDMMEILVGLMMVPEGGLVTSGASFAVKGVSNLVDDALKVGIKGEGLVNDVAKGVLIPLGLGSTGRTAANNLTEQLAMKEIMSNPTIGKVLIQKMKDASVRWNGWSKMPNKTAHGVEIHYNALWEDGVIKYIDDFKFIGDK